MSPWGPPLYVYTDVSQLTTPGVPGFTDMADGWIIPEYFAEANSLGEFVFALTDTEQKVSGHHSHQLDQGQVQQLKILRMM